MSENGTSQCAICDAIENGLRNDDSTARENTILWESRRFVVLPCVGPLVAGHVMVASREHFPSLAAMGSEAILEYTQLLSDVRRNRAKCCIAMLEAEHGATDDDCGGACITHAHIQWIPGFADFEDLFHGVLPLISEGNDLHVPNTKQPYVFVRGSSKISRVYDATGLPSQMVRQVICTQLGRNDWDWRQFPHLDLVEETVKQWEVDRGQTA